MCFHDDIESIENHENVWTTESVDTLDRSAVSQDARWTLPDFKIIGKQLKIKMFHMD